jgi:ATP-dependent DNA helicase RecG
MQESETIEYKKSLAELSDGLNSIAAILNKHGRGALWFGIKNNGSPAGMDVSETTLRKVSQAIAAHIEPKIYPDVSKVVLDGKSCIRVTFTGSETPYYAHGRAYMRVADEDRQLSAKELETIILRKNRTHRNWDSEPIQDESFKPDTAKLRSFVRKAGLTWSNAAAALENLGLSVDGKLLNAARVFFAKPPALTLRCAVFANTTSATIIDQHDFPGDILTLIDEAEKYVLKNIRIGMKLDGLVRVDVPEINREALREAIINAFCHRDYRDRDEVRVAIYKDRVEIRNPGILMDGISLKTLKTGKVSRRRNPIIADLLRRIHLVEAWGRGIPLILDKAPNVRFSQIAGIFITEFPRPVPAKDTESRPESRPESGLESGPESIERKALVALSKCPLSKSEIATAIGHKSISGKLNQRIRQMIEAGLIEHTIPEKPNSRLQKYRLTEKGRRMIYEG